MTPKLKTVFGVLASAALAAGAFFALTQQGTKSGPEVLTEDCFALDTFCTVTVYEGGNRESLEQIRELLYYYDGLFSCDAQNSDLYRINHRETEKVAIASETAEMLLLAKQTEKETERALLVSIRPLTKLWDIANRKTPPADMEIQNAKKESEEGSWEILRDGDACYFFSEDSFVQLETGAYAKGYIADRLKEKMKKAGITSALIDLGGNIQTIGENPDGTGFRIGIRDPENREGYKELAEVSDESVVTAGCYERFFEYEGKQYHHILDPGTGWPVGNGLASVTVIGPSSFLCDAFSTAFYVMGEEKAAAFLKARNSRENERYSAVFIFRDGTVRWNND